MNFQHLLSYTQKTLAGQSVSPEEAYELITLPAADTPLLLAMADKIRRHFHDDTVDCCAIINGRSGKCPENCRFCAQSAHYQTGVTEYPLVDTDTVIATARRAKAAGAARFAIVTSGRSVAEGEEFESVLHALSCIKKRSIWKPAVPSASLPCDKRRP